MLQTVDFQAIRIGEAIYAMFLGFVVNFREFQMWLRTCWTSEVAFNVIRCLGLLAAGFGRCSPFWPPEEAPQTIVVCLI